MTLLLVLVLLAAVLVGLWIYTTANRLDRLHVRTDSAWLALESALGRRAVVVRTIASVGAGPEVDPRLAALADRAERTDRAGREAAENAVSAALGSVRAEALSPQLAAELTDAEARVLLARRFHNDAVRDTLALRRRRSVRLLRLGGTAPLPAYFEIAERPVVVLTGPRRRPSSRVLLLDPEGRVLLLRGSEPSVPGVHFWFTTGGGTVPGEGVKAAGVREVAEETGLVLAESALRGPMWWRRSVFMFDGDPIEAEETYFAAAVDTFVPRGEGHTALERRTLSDARWCGPQQVRALEAMGERVYPPGLDRLLAEAVTLITSGADAPPPVLRSIP